MRLPGGFMWEDEWRIDTTYAHTDPDGWCYAGSFATIASTSKMSSLRCSCAITQRRAVPLRSSSLKRSHSASPASWTAYVMS